MANEVITRIEVDCETGNTRIIPLTPQELAELEERAAAREVELVELAAAAEAEATAKAATIEKLSLLGLTQEEIATLIK